MLVLVEAKLRTSSMTTLRRNFHEFSQKVPAKLEGTQVFISMKMTQLQDAGNGAQYPEDLETLE